MLKQIILATTMGFATISAMAANTIVEMKTSVGVVELELYDDKAPITVDNFKRYIDSSFYNGTVFHRVIPGFMIQGGGMTTDLSEKQTNETIRNESSNGLLNSRGTLAMARRNDPNSASSQFFINLEDNAFLNKAERNAGYAVFGKVIKGMDIVDKIANVPTQNKLTHQDVPVEAVEITNMKIKAPTN